MKGFVNYCLTWIIPIVLIESFEIDDLVKAKKCVSEIKSIKCSQLRRHEVDSLFGALNDSENNRHNDLETFALTLSDFEHLPLLPRLPALRFLDLSSNNISELANPLQITLRNVAYLNLKNNSLGLISHDAFSMFPNLEVIHLEENKILSVDWEAFRLFKLRELYISNNYLPVISGHMLRFTPNLELLDLSGNQIAIVQSSSFYPAQRLSTINLSHNRIQHFKYDSFSTLNQVTTLDLSYNNMTSLPGLDLKQIVGLKMLNLSGNPFGRIVSGDISLPALEELRIDYCQNLKLLEAGAFSGVPKLKRISVAHNPQLTYVSPDSFINVSQLDNIDFRNNSLSNFAPKLFEITKAVQLSGNPFNCNCFSPQLTKFGNIISDKSSISCKTSSSSPNSCSTQPFLAFGNTLVANLGSCFSIYCASTTFSSSIFWTFPNGTHVVGNQSEVPWALNQDKGYAFLPFHVNNDMRADLAAQEGQMRSLDGSIATDNNAARIAATSEQLRFDAVLPEDAGVYRCETHGPDGQTKSQEIHVTIDTPEIQIEPVEIGSYFVTVSWNNSLKICDYTRVSSFLTVQDADGVTRRYTRLSLHNPWRSYNVMRLKPLQNYTICLLYVFNINSQKRNIFETCIDVQTVDSPSFWNSVSITTVSIVLGIPLTLWILVLVRALYYKLHIWHDTTVRAKMNQSISGQSFLSRSSTMASSPSATFIENGNTAGASSMGQSTQMSVLGPLIEEDGYTLEYENNAAL
uniref:Ig-like domain-containing protein n=1 Tax=Panagrellus redivivus TaxID=6233 RepID=A0A7E4ULH1_PANRE